MNKKYAHNLKYLLTCIDQEKGFTLIELLVVVIIVGILAAVAVPNFLRQAGKAREAEFKNAVGTINRAQQGYHFERQVFAQGANDNESLILLGTSFDARYIDPNGYNIVANGGSDATTSLVNAEFQIDGTRAYSGGTFYSASNYQVIVCASLATSQQIPAPAGPNDCLGNVVIK